MTPQQPPSAGETVELALPGGQQFAHAFGVLCCLFLALTPSIALARLLPYPVLQVGAGLVALAGLAVAPGVFGRSRLTVSPAGIELSRPGLRLEWSELEVSQVTALRAPRRSRLVGTPGWQGYLELYPTDPDDVLRRFPSARRLCPRRQAGVLRISLKERRDLLTVVDAAMTRYGRPGYQGVAGDEA